MKIRVISSKEEIDSLGSNEQIVHLTFRPSGTDILSIVTKCPGVKALHVPPSFKKTISKSIQVFLEMRGITLLDSDVWVTGKPLWQKEWHHRNQTSTEKNMRSHKKCINECSEIAESIYDRILIKRTIGCSISMK